jgi:hypothetical protein
MGILLTNIEREHYNDRDPWTPYWSDYVKTDYNPYLELSAGRPNLVICYGDSWTWGDSLVKNITGSSDDEPQVRLDNIYGRKLADMLDADFVNCAIPGIYNYWMIDRLNILINHDLDNLCQKYNKIYIVVTLTEIGRDFQLDKYCLEFEDFFAVNSNTTPEEICQACERFEFIQLNNVAQKLPNKVQMIVGRNFTHIQKNNNTFNFLISKSWTDLLFEQQNFDHDQNVLMVGVGVAKFDAYIKDKKIDNQYYKQWFENVLWPSSTKQISMLNLSKLNYKSQSKHPTVEGHKIWADYIFKNLN